MMTIENVCKQCEEVYKKYNQKVKQISNDTKIVLPETGYYYYGIVDCWKCKKEIIVFAWEEWGEWDEEKPQEIPIPSTIKFMYSKTAVAKYWVNTCPYCNAIQGDWFLFSKPDGPFFALHETVGKVSPELLLMKIASRCLEGLYPDREMSEDCKVCNLI